MDIFDAMGILQAQNVVEDASIQGISSLDERANLNEAIRLLGHSDAYRSLSAQDGQAIALAALTFFDTGLYTDEYIPHQILTHLAESVPGSLQGLYLRLLERDLGWDANVLFREANTATRDRIIAELTSEKLYPYSREDLLCALAWIGDKTVQQLFGQWRQEPPTWCLSLAIPPEDYAYEAGWELTATGDRRDLYYHHAYDLLVRHLSEDAGQHAVRIGLKSEERCGWCGHQLTILFDIDLHDPRMALLNIQGERFRLAQCLGCALSFENSVFTDIHWNGASSWSNVNGTFPETSRNKPGNKVIFLPSKKFVLGSMRRTPYERAGSHLGGCPGWVQNADYPRCPICQQTMFFIGQLEPQIPSLEGIIYAFLCKNCGKATTVYQQT